MSKRLTIAVIAVGVIIGGCGDKKTPAPDNQFTDPRDGTVYRTVKIGNRTWMAENLNYRTKDSWCYDNADSNCVKYGRLYTWFAAMEACPAGWRLPSDSDWDSLVVAVGGTCCESDWTYGEKAGKKLKSKSGWKDDGNGTDDYGFSALPGGSRRTDGRFNGVGNYGNWWCAMEDWDRRIGYSHQRGRGMQNSMYEDCDGMYQRPSQDIDRVARVSDNSLSGLQVRCVRD